MIYIQMEYTFEVLDVEVVDVGQQELSRFVVRSTLCLFEKEEVENFEQQGIIQRQIKTRCK
jgi:hypothetical protein